MSTTALCCHTDCHMWKIFNILDSNFLSGEAIDSLVAPPQAVRELIRASGFCGKTRHLPEKFASGLKKPFLPEINSQSFEGSLTGW